jgi:hypothetical protein
MSAAVLQIPLFTLSEEEQKSHSWNKNGNKIFKKGKSDYFQNNADPLAIPT